ncbi:hypothetical protein F511_37118 [Dorcoceras hygrometricum]|uniref:Uncharacterized protein n=1 Tax=Dorcoceras hygrometricum TaxID=472368 RepID=A0A2Z7D3K8_9LAMI|nr:hypothetical protein F511_37118 [Dorcoceras hygrometricum]
MLNRSWLQCPQTSSGLHAALSPAYSSARTCYQLSHPTTHVPNRSLLRLRLTAAPITRIQHRVLYNTTRQLTSPQVRSHPSKPALDALSSLQQLNSLRRTLSSQNLRLRAAHSIHSCTARSTGQITHTGQLARTQQISSKLELRTDFVLPDCYRYPLSKLKITTTLVYTGHHHQPRLKLNNLRYHIVSHADQLRSRISITTHTPQTSDYYSSRITLTSVSTVRTTHLWMCLTAYDAQKSRVLETPVGARHKCQRGNMLKHPMNVVEC